MSEYYIEVFTTKRGENWRFETFEKTEKGNHPLIINLDCNFSEVSISKDEVKITLTRELKAILGKETITIPMWDIDGILYEIADGFCIYVNGDCEFCKFVKTLIE